MASDKHQPETVVQISKNFKDIKMSLPKLKKLVKTICKCSNTEQNKSKVVSIAIVGSAEIRKVNKKYLNHNCSTDVISFDLSDENRKLYELVVNGEMAVKQAEQRGHSSEAELALYITHGLLHNLGYDDSTRKQAREMHEEEDRILQQFGYGLVYNS